LLNPEGEEYDFRHPGISQWDLCFGEMPVGEDAPSRTNYMILDTQGHRSHISALGELIVDACIIQRTKNMISDIQRRRSSVSALGELIVDGCVIHWPKNRAYVNRLFAGLFSSGFARFCGFRFPYGHLVDKCIGWIAGIKVEIKIRSLGWHGNHMMSG
jgi:hypothetical protein